MIFNCGMILTHYNLFNEFYAVVLLAICPKHAARPSDHPGTIRETLKNMLKAIFSL